MISSISSTNIVKNYFSLKKLEEKLKLIKDSTQAKVKHI